MAKKVLFVDCSKCKREGQLVEPRLGGFPKKCYFCDGKGFFDYFSLDREKRDELVVKMSTSEFEEFRANLKAFQELNVHIDQ